MPGMDRLSLVNALGLSLRGYGEEAARVERLQAETHGQGLTPAQTAVLLESHHRMALLGQNAMHSMIVFLAGPDPDPGQR